MKKGDKYYCKKNLTTEFVHIWGTIRGTFFIKGKWYTIQKIDERKTVISCEQYNIIGIQIDAMKVDKSELKEYFYTLSQTRKLKLNKLNK